MKTFIDAALFALATTAWTLYQLAKPTVVILIATMSLAMILD